MKREDWISYTVEIGKNGEKDVLVIFKGDNEIARKEMDGSMADFEYEEIVEDVLREIGEVA